jgi:hypothetical protein
MAQVMVSGASSVTVAEVTEMSGSTGINSVVMASIEAPVMEVAPVAPSVPSGFSPDEWKAKLARVAAGEESGVCESCES